MGSAAAPVHSAIGWKSEITRRTAGRPSVAIAKRILGGSDDRRQDLKELAVFPI
jgi:hypothetical protein